MTALRECDGENCQALMIVRADFQLPLYRFMEKLRVPLQQDRNYFLVDLFDLDHAKKVLTLFGQAYGKLPNDSRQMGAEDLRFVEEAIDSLAEKEGNERYVSPVRLALFAEMIKRNSWTRTTLSDAGGPEGLVISYLEKAFGSRYGKPAPHHAHERAAQAVLRDLLPGPGSNLRGHMRSERELWEASGFVDRESFLNLIGVLDRETRLVTPTHPEGADEARPQPAAPGNAYYQLTHDFLVPSLREWLTQKRLAAFPDHVRTFRPSGTPDELFASGLVNRLIDTATAQAPAIISEMQDYRRWTDPLLRTAYAEAQRTGNLQRQLRASLALLPVDAGQVEYLYGRLLEAEPHELAVIRDALFPYEQQFLDRLWAVLERWEKGRENQRLRAACALATYDPGSPRWERASTSVVEQLVSVNPVFLAPWMEGFRPVRAKLLAPLSAAFRDRGEGRTPERSLATSILADYAADEPQVMADLLMDADEKQFALMYAKVKEHGDRGLPLLFGEVGKTLPPEAKDEARERLAKRQANAAVGLLRMNQPDRVWPLLKHSPDPRGRSYLIHRFGPLGTDAGVLVERLEVEPEVAVRRALILSLGPEEFGEEAWTPEVKDVLVQRLREMYCTAPDPGLHAAAEWLLRQWQQEAWLAQTYDAWAKDSEQRQKRLEGITQALAGEQAEAKPQWYVNGQGQTMVVIPGPVEFLMGSPPTEAGRYADERRHRRRIGRTFAIAAKPVTVEQYRAFSNRYEALKEYAPTEDCPAHGTSWHRAAAYCNWLSHREGLPRDQWYYQADPQGRATRMKGNSLGLIGYRLPTEAEWEYACRAGAVTSRYYGESEELLKNYAWYLENAKNRSWPVGGKKPNDLGLFDLHGNVWAWCQDRYEDYPEAKGIEAVEDPEEVLGIEDNNDSRVLRGSSFGSPAVFVRSANRERDVPTNGDDYVGFRPARSFR
jgi:formylglycine-generating enzyme required for sulfatase activity